MTEQALAERLAGAVDELVRSRTRTGQPGGPDHEELESLLRVALARIRVTEATTRAGQRLQDPIWRMILTRLASGRRPTAGK